MIKKNILIYSLILVFLNGCAASSVQKKQGTTKATQTTSEANKLDAFKWRVVAIQNGSKVLQSKIQGIPLSRYQLNFIGKRFGLSGGCNRISGAVKHEKSSIKFSRMFSTRIACRPAASMKADTALEKILQGVTFYRLQENNTLILGGYNGGQSLLLRGTPTNETKYGGKGTRKFIQIRNTPQGLVWREAKYNAKYIQINKNARWETTPLRAIQGFTPKPNREYTVRIKEYYDAQQGKKVWVKDMVVMQGNLR